MKIQSSKTWSQVWLVLTHAVKSQAQRTEMVDGSNESLDHTDEELDTLLRKYSFAY